MFGVGNPEIGNRDAIKGALKRAIKSPNHLWIPISPTPLTVKEPSSLPHWSKIFPKAEEDTILPARKDLENLIDAYFCMGHWDFAFMCVAIVYWGRPMVPSMDNFTWAGPPGASRPWVIRGRVMIPVPNGPVRTAVETWWALSGGYLNPTRQMLPIDIMAFDAHLRSIDSPIILVRPFGSDDPDYVLQKLHEMHVNELAYPTAPGYSAISDIAAKTTKKWYAYWVNDIPIETEKLHPAPRQDAEACESGPLGLKWLEASKDTIPPRIYRKAHSLRKNGYARV